MKQLLILSGKGGTGKTTLASAFIKFSQAKAYADCDVDAPNLHLVLEQETAPLISDYYGLPKAEIDYSLCQECGLCLENCRFEAIVYTDKYEIEPYSCEGCGVCEEICAFGAISLKPAVAGELRLFDSGRTVFSTAELKMGSGNSGLLVTEVKKQMRDAAIAAELVIIDGSPGIGCPVISSLSGVDLALIVTEPSLSGLSDLDRIVKTAGVFQTKVVVCVNKFDVNLENTETIIRYCRDNGLGFIGKIPYDPEALRAVNRGMTIADVDCPSGRAAEMIYNKLIAKIIA